MMKSRLFSTKFTEITPHANIPAMRAPLPPPQTVCLQAAGTGFSQFSKHQDPCLLSPPHQHSRYSYLPRKQKCPPMTPHAQPVSSMSSALCRSFYSLSHLQLHTPRHSLQADCLPSTPQLCAEGSPCAQEAGLCPHECRCSWMPLLSLPGPHGHVSTLDSGIPGFNFPILFPLHIYSVLAGTFLCSASPCRGTQASQASVLAPSFLFLFFPK